MKTPSPLTRILSRQLACACLASALVFTGVATGAEASSTLLFSGGWSQAQSADALNAFQAWVQHYTAAADANAKAGMIGQGVAAAKAHRAALSALIVSNPEKAILAAVPASVRSSLPAEVVAQLETRVSGVGDFTVVCPFPAKNAPTTGSL